MDLSIIVINWNTRDLLYNCLRSVFFEIGNHGIEFEVLVVDNGSSDGSQEMVRTEFKGVKLIESRENMGYCRAANLGVQQSKGRHVLIANSDIEFKEGHLSRVVSFMDDNPGVGAVGPRLINSDGSIQHSCRNFPSFVDATVHAFAGIFFPSNRFSRRYEMMDFDHDKISRVGWVSGACILFRREAFEGVSGFDERYFMYVEDMDICYSLNAAGYSIYYYPDITALHMIGQSSKRASYRMISEFQKSIFKFYRKRYSGSFMVFIIPFIFLGLMVRAAVLLLINIFKR
ncbi:MAG: glycosyltransferase family 2 protein [Actinobacteria bacterium]|nr:glycosyltransferase family 2 protein [Actinomycetota bacterium]